MGSLKTPTVVSINAKRAFTGDDEKIRMSTTELLLRANANDLAKSKRFCDWASSYTVLIPSFLTKEVVTEKETAA